MRPFRAQNPPMAAQTEPNATCIPTLLRRGLLHRAPSPNADECASLFSRRQRQEAPPRDFYQARFGDVVLDDRGDAR